ncbi:T9SS type A sorting domain-containing protein [Flavobacterium sp.]|uniref:T9SS type A sorting domain-containing protein n=1 Tax=Flavobacterium sp. TaxID=239 RepID=UPI004034A38F
MKTQIFAFLITLLCVPTATQAQITLEQAFPDKWNIFTTTLSDGSIKYIAESNTSLEYYVYNEDYSPYATYSLNISDYCPTGNSGYMDRPLYITDKLFDSDSGIEFAITAYCYDTLTNNYTTSRAFIIDDNNTILFSRDSAALMNNNNSQAFSGIDYNGVVNTSLGAKLLLHVNNGSEIWSLPGSLPVQLEVIAADTPDMGTYPNPVQKSCTVTYNTYGVTSGRLAIRDINGVEVDSQPFYGESGSLQVDVTGLAAGMYTVSLISGENVLGSKKIVVAP